MFRACQYAWKRSCSPGWPLLERQDHATSVTYPQRLATAESINLRHPDSLRHTCLGCGQISLTRVCSFCSALPDVRKLSIAEVERVVSTFFQIGVDTIKPQHLLMGVAISNLKAHERGRSYFNPERRKVLPLILQSMGLNPSCLAELKRLSENPSDLIEICAQWQQGWLAGFFVDEKWSTKHRQELVRVLADQRFDQQTLQWKNLTRDRIIAHLLPLNLTTSEDPTRINTTMGQATLASVYLVTTQEEERVKANRYARYLQKIDLYNGLPLELAKLVLVHELTHTALWLHVPYKVCGHSSVLEEAVCHIVTLFYIDKRLQDQTLLEQERRSLKFRYAVCHDSIVRSGAEGWWEIAKTQGWTGLMNAFFDTCDTVEINEDI
eukprot:Blabericola_migrator_1__3961@NODE_21_length_22536_cov_99_458098_g18_i0_p7_GENE_NODE_21_length_22536_cov_99_458098_g18_i0NODE_21_length_22536_cov_99_458098_g18_i0_p7_ORF_typecomplete_len380_score36_65DA1like/PF12315_8/5e07SprTlike/PF10263_9/0_32_NODE_21_length_22536_cov_99_458098_g18_i080769215